eukprot:2724053-Rhodomonas_salina.1
MGTSTHRPMRDEIAAAGPDRMASLVEKYGAKNVMLVGLMTVVVFCHTATSYFEEQLFKKLKFEQPFFMVWIMSIVYAALYLLVTQFGRQEKRCHPLVSFYRAADRDTFKNLLFICLLCVVSNCSSKLALEYVSIPTQIVFKSCKLVAVMLGSYVVLGRTYTFFEYAVACALVGGMCLFTLGDMRGSSSSLGISSADWQMITGISILCGSLCCDSLLGNLQEKVQKSKACSETELMFVQSAFGTFVLLIIMAFSGELAEAVQAADRQIWATLLFWALCNMLGIVCLLRIVGKFSAVTAVLTSFVRKLSSITISFTFFPKPLTMSHVLGIVLVFGAIGAHSYHKHGQKKAPATESELEEREPLAVISEADDK